MDNWQVTVCGRDLQVSRDSDGIFSIPDEIREMLTQGTALKPAFEPILVFRKPLGEKTVAANVLRHGTGGLNIDACRVPGDNPSIARRDTARSTGTTPGRPGEQGDTITNRISPEAYTAEHPGEALGRWPANLIRDDSEEVADAFAAFGDKKAGVAVGRNASAGTVYGGGKGLVSGDKGDDRLGYGGSGSAARFFYCAKASKSDRGEGNDHPTVKPQSLSRYLVRLVTPPGGIVLDPFMGSGSTLLACAREGFAAVGIDISAEYVAIAQKRLEGVAAAPNQTTEEEHA